MIANSCIRAFPVLLAGWLLMSRPQAADWPQSRGPDSTGKESVSVRVHPAMIPRSHPLAGVGDAFNAVFVEAEAAGQAS